MILYHGSDIEVNNPKIIQAEKGRDFGCGGVCWGDGLAGKQYDIYG